MQRIVKSEVYDYRAYRKTVDLICERYNSITPFTIGQSCAGRDIIALKLGKFKSFSLFAATFHGSEYITTNVLLYFIEDLCHALENNIALSGINIEKVLNTGGIIFVPLVNPDGCEISIHGAAAAGKCAESLSRLCRGDFKHWNANLRGVDINHNFDADWHSLRTLERENGIYGPSPTRYGGRCPESEPETRALCELCRNTDIRHALALHSQGEVIYWGYNGYSTDKNRKMAEIMARTSGYALDVPQGLASGGGFKDWFVKEIARPAFTIELGKGKNPLPIGNAASIYDTVREMLTLSTLM